MQLSYYKDGLQSERLRSRYITTSDVSVWMPFFNDIESVEFLQPFLKATNEESSQVWIDSQLKRYAENRYGLQIIENKFTGEVLGQCGLLLQEIDGNTEIEVGYHFFKKHWGNGYAPEAARMFFTYAFENNLAESVISIIDIRNIKSQRVAEKNGLKREKQTRWRETMDVYIYRVHKSNWK